MLTHEFYPALCRYGKSTEYTSSIHTSDLHKTSTSSTENQSRFNNSPLQSPGSKLSLVLDLTLVVLLQPVKGCDCRMHLC